MSIFPRPGSTADEIWKCVRSRLLQFSGVSAEWHVEPTCLHFNGLFPGEPALASSLPFSSSIYSGRELSRISGTRFVQANSSSCRPTNSVEALKETRWACCGSLEILIVSAVYLSTVADPTSLPNVQNVDRLKLKLAEFISK